MSKVRITCHERFEFVPMGELTEVWISGFGLDGKRASLCMVLEPPDLLRLAEACRQSYKAAHGEGV